jgi:hypothetical protein
MNGVAAALPEGMSLSDPADRSEPFNPLGSRVITLGEKLAMVGAHVGLDGKLRSMWGKEIRIVRRNYGGPAVCNEQWNARMQEEKELDEKYTVVAIATYNP